MKIMNRCAYIPIIIFSLFMLNNNDGQSQELIFKCDNTFFPVTSYRAVADWIGKEFSKDLSLISFNDTTNQDNARNINRLPDCHSSHWQHITYRLTYKDIPLEDAEIKVHIKDGIVLSITGAMYDSIQINTTPSVSESDAKMQAIKYVEANEYNGESKGPDNNYYSLGTQQLVSISRGELVICSQTLSDGKMVPKLAYKFKIHSTRPHYGGYIYIDAATGSFIVEKPLFLPVLGTAATRYSGVQQISTTFNNTNYILHDMSRGNGIFTYNLQHNVDTTQRVDFIDNDNNWSAAEFHNNQNDDAALDAHWGAMMTYDFFKNTFARNGIDNHDIAIKNYVHYSSYLFNAFWDEEENAMYYGDGAYNNNPLTCLDVIAHEISHGVTQYTAHLSYANESGALNEAISDIWSACVENYVSGNRDIWRIGDCLSDYLRDMSNPKSKTQPDTYHGTYWHPISTHPDYTNDYGGVHSNSGVMNYWFYLLCEGGSGTNDNNEPYTVQGIGIDHAAQIVYNALCNYFSMSTNYSQAAQLTLLSAIELYGYCALETQNVIDAWRAVGIQVENIPEILILSNHIHSAESQHYVAKSIIITTDSIANGANVVYEAGDVIDLLSGFHASRGSNVRINIADCIDNPPFIPIISRDNGHAITTANEITARSNPLYISPNPVMNILSIHGVETPCEYIIYDAMGKIIKAGTLWDTNELDMALFLCGTYILYIKNDYLSDYIKFIKQ